jgi:hypothetical protein
VRKQGRRLAIAACAIGAFAFPAAAGATDITVNDDATGPGPAGANCAAPDQSTITGALTAAAASGDRILVCAGTYVQPQVLIQKSVQLIGAGPGQSIIDGGLAQNLPSAGLIRTNDSTNGDVLVKGFTVRNAGQTGTSPTGNHMSIIPKGNDLGTTQEFADLEVEGLGPGGHDYGIDLDNPDPDVILRDSSIENTDFNPVLIERADGAVTIRGNEIDTDGVGSGTAIFTMNHTNDPTVNPVKIVDNDIDATGSGGIVVQSSYTGLATPGAFNAVEIARNEIANVTSVGVAITNPTAGDGVLGEIANVDVVDNTVTGGATTTGVRVMGRVRNVSVRGNTLADLGTGVLVSTYAPAGHNPLRVAVTLNRIAGNDVAGLTNNSTTAVDAERNWWGCNEGPGQPGCDTVDGTGTTDADPWLVLDLTASPTSILTGGDTSRLTASLRTDSDGDAVGPGFPEGTPIGFTTTLGSVTSPVGTEDGIATSTLSSGSASGTADVSAALDGETVGAQVDIADPPPASPETTIDSGPANGSTTNDATPTFGFSSDDPAATFECRYDAGAWSACSGPGDSDTPGAALSEGIHTFEVRAVDASSTPDPTPAASSFLYDDGVGPREQPERKRARLRIKLDPEVGRARLGWGVRYRVVLRNNGNAAANAAGLCIKVPAALEPSGKRCRAIDSVGAHEKVVKRFRVRTGDDTRPGVYGIKFVATTPAGVADRAKARLRVRPIPEAQR